MDLRSNTYLAPYIWGRSADLGPISAAWPSFSSKISFPTTNRWKFQNLRFWSFFLQFGPKSVSCAWKVNRSRGDTSKIKWKKRENWSIPWRLRTKSEIVLGSEVFETRILQEKIEKKKISGQKMKIQSKIQRNFAVFEADLRFWGRSAYF